MCRRLLDLDVFAGVIPPRDELLQDPKRIFVSAAKVAWMVGGRSTLPIFTLRCLFFGPSSSVFIIERLLRTSNSLGFVMFDVDASQVVQDLFRVEKVS